MRWAAYILAFLVAAGGYLGYRKYLDLREAERSVRAENAALRRTVGELRSELDRMREERRKIQEEEERLAAQNRALLETLAQVKATGKAPKNLPREVYPPK